VLIGSATPLRSPQRLAYSLTPECADVKDHLYYLRSGLHSTANFFVQATRCPSDGVLYLQRILDEQDPSDDDHAAQ